MLTMSSVVFTCLQTVADKIKAAKSIAIVGGGPVGVEVRLHAGMQWFIVWLYGHGGRLFADITVNK